MADGENGGGTPDVSALQAELGSAKAALAEAQAELVRVEVENAAVTQARDLLATDLEAATAKASDDAKALSDAQAVIDTLTKDKTDLLEKLKATEDAPRAELVAVTKVRNVGPVEKNPSPAKLLEMIQQGGSVQIAFSDGKKEIAALPPMDITGQAWAVQVTGLALRVGSLVISPTGDGAADLAGYGLFIDTKQVAYAARIDRLRIAPGQKMNITNDVIFGG